MARFKKSKVWDKSTQQSVDAVRAFIHRHPQPTISQIQQESIKERPSKSSCHLIPDVLSVPIEDDVRQLLFRTINDLGQIEYQRPDLVPVPVEWVGKKIHNFLDLSACSSRKGRLTGLALDVENDLIILHVHGGAFFQGSPSSYRPIMAELASLSGGRVVSVDYRLSPQNPFPAAILDVLVAYLSLLYPSSDAPYKPVDASRVVFAGDSAGGVLLFCVLQVLLHNVSDSHIRFKEKTIPLPIPKPAGTAVISLPGDFMHSLPSFEANRTHDLFLEVPWHRPDYPSCPLWPVDPPRPDIYCSTESFNHPLVTLALLKSWEGAPPIWLASGEEVFADGAKAVARRAARQNVHVTWMQFEAMPHCFPIVPGLTQSKQTRAFMKNWAMFCRRCVDGADNDDQKVKAIRVSYPDAEEQISELEGPADPSLEEIESMIRTKVRLADREFKQHLSQVVRAKF